jgi:hypothetical protein
MHPMVRTTIGAVYRRRMTDHDLAADLRRVAHRAFANLDGRTTDTSDETMVRDVVADEDDWMTASTQTGIHSGAQPHVVFGRNEQALQHYHRALSDAIG